MASYDQPEYVDKRPRYFDGQFLREQDFIDEQIYQIDRQRRAARMFLSPGVAQGLAVARGEAAGTLAVEPGTALDGAGRLIVLKERTVVPVALRGVTGATLQIFWRQEESDRAEGGGSAGNTRWYEKPGFEVVASGATPQSRDAVLLAGFDVAADGTIALRTGSRAVAGVRSLGALTVAGTSTFSGNVGVGGNPSAHALTVGTDPSADIWRAQLALHGSALRTEARLAFTTTLGDGSAAHMAMIKAVVPTENGGDLVFQTRDQAFGTLGERLRIRNNGNVGIGTAAPAGKLDVQGGDIRTSGAIRWNNGTSTLSNDQGGAIELGSSTQTGARPFIDFHYGVGSEQDFNIRIMNTANQKLAILGGDLGIGTEAPATRLAIAGPSSTVNVEVADFVRLIRPYVLNVKNNNSAGFAVGAFETGISGRSRLDIKLAGAPVEANKFGEIPDVTVMTLQANGNVGIGTAAPAKRLDIQGGSARVSGNLGTRGQDPDAGYPDGWGGGVHTWDVYAQGTVAAGQDGQVGGYFNSLGDAAFGGEVSVGKRLLLNGDVSIQGKHALRGNDAWLRLNQEGVFPNGVHTPYLFSSRSLNVGGAGSWGNPGEGNAWIAGNLGIGTTTPQARLDVNGDVSIQGKHALRGNDTWLRLNEDGAFPNGVHTPYLFSSGSLNVGGAANIGTTMTSSRLRVGGGGAIINGIAIGTDAPGIDIPYEYESIGVTGSSMNLRLHSPNSIILHSKTHVIGNLGIGNYSADSMPSWSGGGLVCWDVIFYGGLHDMSKSSTVRVKEHFQPLTGVLDRIEHLNPVRFNYRAADRPQRDGIGFIAEEMYEVFPECVIGDDDFFARGIKESTLHALAIAGIQELARKVKLLEHRLGQPDRQLQTEQRPPIAILREGVDASGTGEAYVTVRFSAHHAALDRVETVRTLRLPPDVPREQFLQAERERWLAGLDKAI